MALTSVSVASATSAVLVGSDIKGGASLVNISNNQVWIADSTAVTTGYGVPLAAQGSVTITRDGPVYAILDSGATGPATLVLTDSADNYANPAAIALQTAQQLLATGVPNVLTTATIANRQNVVNGSTHAYDVSGYASLLLVGPGGQFALTWTDALGNTASTQTALPGNGQVTEIPVIAPRIVITYNGIAASLFSLYGSNRAMHTGVSSRNNDSGGDYWQLAVASQSGTQPLIQQTPQVHMQGQLLAVFFLSGTTVTGTFRLNSANAANMNLCSTSEMASNPSGSRTFRTMIGMGASPYSFDFVIGTTGNATASIQLMPANLG